MYETLITALIVAAIFMGVIYYSNIAHYQSMRRLDGIILGLKRDNFELFLRTLPPLDSVNSYVKDIRDLENKLDVPCMDFSKQFEEYKNLKKTVDERRYL